MASARRRRGGWGKDKDAAVRAQLREKLGLKGDRFHTFIEGMDDYEEEYKRLKKRVLWEHPSLLGIYECDDEVFYNMRAEQQLRRFNLDHFTRVLFKTTDEIDLSKDPTTSAGGVVNDKRPRTEGVCVTGNTTIVERDGKRRSVVFMRREIGAVSTAEAGEGVDPRQVKSGAKVSALLHEAGHVDDFEKQINYRGDTIALVEAEVYAHHYACRAMVEGNYLITLNFYIEEGLQKMSLSDSEYIRLAATQVLESPECQGYRAAIARYQERMANLK